jgi:hypothetical protein
MRKFVGVEVAFILDGIGMVKGTVVQDLRDRVLVRGKDGKVIRLIKTKIIAFTPEREPKDVPPLQILSCDNASRGCRGVRYVKPGDGFRPSDCDGFMKACPCRSDSCRRGSLGELRCVDPEELSEMLGGTLYGDYPNPEAKT